ncbi:hypothetical protein KCV08_19870, partial [Acinetobacter baumannii]
MLQPAVRTGAPMRAFFPKLLALLAMAMLWLAWNAPARAEAEFLEPEKAFVFSAAMATPDTVELRFRVAPGYYMYR